MPISRIYNLGELQLKISPFLTKEGSLLRSYNVKRDTIGAYEKRSGYTSYLGTPDNSPVNSLFSWLKNDGTTLYTYRVSGGILYYSTQGTGSWTVCGNGTFTSGNHVGYAILDDTMIAGDGTANTRHSTTGTSFTDTTAAPKSSEFVDYQGRIYSARGSANAGTDTNMFFSTTGTATDWTTDSSSIRIPGAGKVLSLFKSNDRIVVTKDSGQMFTWDGFTLFDLATSWGPSSPFSVANIEDYKIYFNRKGFMGFGGGRPELISNAIERQVYNDQGQGIPGTSFGSAPATAYKYDYFCAVGTLTDDLIGQTISNCVMKYDYQNNEFSNWSFANFPAAFHSYRDTSGVEQLIWGDANGQCYQLAGTSLTDNGSPIESALMGMLHFGQPETRKRFNYVWAFANPGCQAKIQVAIADTFTKGKLNWIDLKQLKDGVFEARFPSGSQGKLLFWKLYESSMESKFQFYGFSVDMDYLPINNT